MKTLRLVSVLRPAIPAVLLALAVLVLNGSAAQAADPFKDWQLAALADLAYTTDNEVKLLGIKNQGETKSRPFAEFIFKNYTYTPLYRLNEPKTQVQALALFRHDGTLIISYAGTKDPFDVLADLGLGAEERNYQQQKSVYDAIDKGKELGIYTEKEAGLLRQTQLKSSYSPATKHGKPEGCPTGTFFDPRNGGECWSCPKGQLRTIFPVDDKRKACFVPPGLVAKKAKKKKKGGGLLGLDCAKGQFINLADKTCYQCDSGYSHNPVLPATVNGVCFKKVKEKYGPAKKENDFLCPRGQFLDLGLGTCWSCPEDYGRTVENVQSAQACLKQYRSDKRVYSRSSKAARIDDQMMVARKFADGFLDNKGKVLPAVLAEYGLNKVDRVVITGHSLGGYVAQVIAAERDLDALTFNAPGALAYAPKLQGRKTRNIARANDVVGQFGTHIGKKVDVPDLSPKNEGAGWAGANHSITRLSEDLAKANQ